MDTFPFPWISIHFDFDSRHANMAQKDGHHSVPTALLRFKLACAAMTWLAISGTPALVGLYCL
jgi:hypothetical protein